MVAGKVIRKSLTAVVSTDAAVGLEVRRVVPAAVAGGGSVDVQIASASPLSPRPLTSQEQNIVTLVAALSAQFAEMKGASAEVTVFVGLVVYLLLHEYARRYARPDE